MSTAEPLTEAARRLLVERLRSALDNDLGAVDALLAELRAGLAGTPLSPVADRLYERVDVFDIDGALSLLAELHDGRHTSPEPDDPSATTS